MTNNKQINESLELAIEIEFETLGNVLADYLLSLELKTIAKITTPSPSHVEQVSRLVDSYARQLDKILNNYKTDMTRDIKELTKYLSVDLKNSRNPSSKVSPSFPHASSRSSPRKRESRK